MATEATPQTITIAVKPATSYLPGTVGWVQQQLRSLQLEVRATSGINNVQKAALMCHFEEGRMGSRLLAFIGRPKQFGLRNPDSDSYVVHCAPSANVADRIYSLAPDTSTGKQGLFDYVTPAAGRVVDAFLDEAVAAFREALNHDDEVPQLTFRVEFSAA